MINKKKIIVLFLFVFSLFMIMGSINATTLNPSDNVKTIVENAASGSVINLNPNNGEFNLNSQIVISKTITIQSTSSSKNAVINMNKKDRAFFVEKNAKLTLKNITIKNGKGEASGWFVESGGGAIYNEGGTLTLTGCTFTQNTAGSYGGAIYNNDGGSITLTGCTFTQNTVHSDGGAIYTGSKGGILTLTACTFTSNQVSLDGGAISGGTLILSGCTFTKNIAGYSGGAILSYGAVTLTGCTFTENKAGHYGGAIRTYSKTTLSNCTFIKNTANSGGAIQSNGETLTLRGCTFTQNTASDSGGAIFFMSELGRTNVLTANNCIFTLNTATDGGAIDTRSKTTLTTCTFTKNTASTAGAIYSTSDLTVNSCTFTENKANTDGGAIRNSGILTVNKGTFTQNSAVGFGGILYNSRLATFIGSTFVKNTGAAGDHNGAFYKPNPNCVTNLNGCTFSTGTTGNTVANTAKADLKITKVTKKGNIRYVFVKNIGKKSAGKNTLGVYIGKTLIKKVSVKAIGIGKTLKVTVAIPKKYATKKFNNQFKTFKVDIKNVVKESNKNNNSFKAK